LSLQYLRDINVIILPAQGLAKIISGLRVKIRCEKSNEGKTNIGNVYLYNLNDDSRSMLEAKSTRVQVNAGYLGIDAPGKSGLLGSAAVSGSSVEPVFIGNIVKVEHKREQADIITKVKLQDGGNHYRNIGFDKGYPPGVRLVDVIVDLSNKIALNKGSFVDIPNFKYANGLSLSGMVKDHMDMLCTTFQLEWSIQNETVQVIPKNLAIGSEIIIVSPDTGMVGFPTKTDKGVEFSALMNPKFRVGARVQIQGSTVLPPGVFKIRKVNHEGDTYEGDFLSKCECTRMSNG